MATAEATAVQRRMEIMAKVLMVGVQTDKGHDVAVALAARFALEVEECSVDGICGKLGRLSVRGSRYALPRYLG